MPIVLGQVDLVHVVPTVVEAGPELLVEAMENWDVTSTSGGNYGFDVHDGVGMFEVIFEKAV